MNHDITLEGPGYRLRPVTVADAAFILDLRTDERLSRFIHPVSGILADQERWIEAYLERDGDYYFVVERRSDGRPEGTIGIYNVEFGPRRAEWGRWVLRRGSLAAVESAILIYRAAFEVLGLAEVYSLTISDNAQVVSFHDSFGLSVVRVHPGRIVLHGTAYDAVEHHLTPDAWEALRPAVEVKAARIARALAPR